MSFSTFTLADLNQLVIAAQWSEEEVPVIFNRFLWLVWAEEEDHIIFGNNHFWEIAMGNNSERTGEEEIMQMGGGNQDESDDNLDRYLDIGDHSGPM